MKIEAVAATSSIYGRTYVPAYGTSSAVPPMSALVWYELVPPDYEHLSYNLATEAFKTLLAASLIFSNPASARCSLERRVDEPHV
eukprot:SAG31_NODE_5804_length_2322_cov_2.267656_3_plen_85_part_00